MEGNNYGFKFDPNKIEKSFDNGSKLSIENDGQIEDMLLRIIQIKRKVIKN